MFSLKWDGFIMAAKARKKKEDKKENKKEEIREPRNDICQICIKMLKY